MVLVNVHWLHLWGMPMVRPVGYAVILISCLLVLGLVNARLWQAPGTPGALIFAAIASYWVIGSVALFVTDVQWQPNMGRDILRQAFFFIVLLGAALGGRALLKRIGVEALLKGMLALLTASCLVIVASPVLRDLGVLPLYRLPFRFTGGFTDPNDAGFIGCITAVLALAFIINGQSRKRAYLGLTGGCAAVLVSFSKGASVALGVLSIFFLLANGLGRRHPILRYLPVLCLGIIVFQRGEYLHKFNIYPDYSYNDFCSTVPLKKSYLGRDCAILLAVRDTLAGDVALNWNDSVPIPFWQGVELYWGVVGLDLSRMELSGRIPPALGGLDQLVSLRLNHNRLTGPIPPELGNLANLRELRLAENELTGVVPAELKALDSLLVLSLEGNNFSTVSQAQAVSDTARAAPPVPGATKAASVFGPPKHTRDIKLTVSGEKISYGMAASRPQLWKLGLKKIQESPIVGSGLGRLYYLEGGLLNHNDRPAGVHNVYLLLVGEAGIVPLSLYLLFLFSLMRLLWTAPKSLVRDAIVGWAMVMAVFGIAFHHLLAMGAFVFLAGLSCAMAPVCEDEGKVEHRPL